LVRRIGRSERRFFTDHEVHSHHVLMVAHTNSNAYFDGQLDDFRDIQMKIPQTPLAISKSPGKLAMPWSRLVSWRSL
jgi:hypothetical protein